MSQLQNCSVKCTKNGSYCENVKKREKKSGGRGGVCTKNGSYCKKEKKVSGGGGGGGQGRCEEWRSEAFVKIQKKNIYFFWGAWGGGGGGGGGSGWGGGGVRVDVN